MSEDGANTFSLAPVNVNKGIQGANINVENLTINIMGHSFEKRKIIIGASILILLVGIVGIALIVNASSTSATSSSSVSDLEGKFSQFVSSEITLFHLTFNNILLSILISLGVRPPKCVTTC